MQGFLIVIHAIVSILLITVILMQASQGGGLAGTIAGGVSNQLFGGRGAASLLSRVTTGFAIAFITLAILINLISTVQTGERESLVKQESESILTPGADLSAPATQDGELELE